MKTTDINIKRASGYGQYLITGQVNGVEVSARTTDSEAFDYLNDDDNHEKRDAAIAHCTFKLELAFENQ